MLACTHSVSFSGIEAIKIDIEVQVSKGLPSFSIVGLADKSIAESRERVRSALHALGLSLPSAHITVNLAPADVIKEGTHYDLPIAVSLMSAMGIVPPESIQGLMMMGELGLDGRIRPVNGILPASMAAVRYDMGFICPEEQGTEASWSGNQGIYAPDSLLSLINHLKGVQMMGHPDIEMPTASLSCSDMRDIKGHESAKRALEIAAVGGHHVLMVGPPGSGKSMLASRMPSIMPSMTKQEILEVSQIHSVAGLLRDGHLVTERPFRSPHYSASTPAMVGGGLKAKPGEISLAHRGILFLDEFPEFSRVTLESLRQPLETGMVSVARANAHTSYPARFQLVAAMNPCKCGYLGVPGHECSRAPKCGEEYRSRISGPMLDRIDLQIEVPLISPWELGNQPTGEASSVIKARVEKAIHFAQKRFEEFHILNNSQAEGEILEKIAVMDEEAKKMLLEAAQKLMLSGRGYHRIIRVARTIADLDFSEIIHAIHMAEALSFRSSFSSMK